jgi:hypothetical protein
LFHRRLLLTTLVLTGALLVAATALAAPLATDQPAAVSGSTIRTSLQPNLSLKSTLSFGKQSLTVAGPIAFHRSCRCGCGGTCRTDADCGPGGVCEPFISCCAKQPGKEWPQDASSGSPNADVTCK